MRLETRLRISTYLLDIFSEVHPGRTWCPGVPGRWPDGGLSEGYGHDGPGVCLGDGQTEACMKDMDMTGLVSA